MKSLGLLLAVICFISLPVDASASSAEHSRETVELDEVLDSVASREGLTFAITAQAPVNIVVGQLDPDDITYAQLHTVLFNNGLAAVTVEDIVNIVPIATIRQQPLPTLSEPDDSIADDQWVTWIYRPQRAWPAMFVPIVRPILPQQGHLVAHPESRTVVLVDRYANALRVIELIRDMDENATEVREE